MAHRIGVPLDDFALSKMKKEETLFWPDFFGEAEIVIDDMKKNGAKDPFIPPDSLRKKYEEAITKYDGRVYCPVRQLETIFKFPPREFITLDWLKEQKACISGINVFANIFGREATIKEVVDYLHETGRPSWEAWLLSRELSFAAAMLKYGADIHADGDYALFLAVKLGNRGIARHLVENGIYVQTSDISMAKYKGYTKTVNLLEEVFNRQSKQVK